MRWWEENTYFLQIENRRGKTNAYHIQWDHLETDWYEIQERIHGVALTPAWRHGGVAAEGVPAQTRHPESVQTRQGGVNTGPTLNIKKNLKGEPQHEMARSLAANDAQGDFLENQLREIIRLQSERVVGPQGLQEGENPSAEPMGLGLCWWKDRVNEAESELQQCTQPSRRKELEEKIARCRAHIEEGNHEQRAKVGAGRK